MQIRHFMPFSNGTTYAKVLFMASIFNLYLVKKKLPTTNISVALDDLHLSRTSTNDATKKIYLQIWNLIQKISISKKTKKLEKKHNITIPNAGEKKQKLSHRIQGSLHYQPKRCTFKNGSIPQNDQRLHLKKFGVTHPKKKGVGFMVIFHDPCHEKPSTIWLVVWLVFPTVDLASLRLESSTLAFSPRKNLFTCDFVETLMEVILYS